MPIELYFKSRLFRAACLAVGFLIFYNLLKWNDRRMRAQKLGRKAPSVPHWAPFGADLLLTALTRVRNDEFFAWLRQILDVPGRTVSMDLLGVKFLFTDNPENTKAILSTNFSDFGRGASFREIWHDLLHDSIFLADGDLWRSNKELLRDHIAKSRSTDYDIMEQHVAILVRNLSDNEPHDCLDQMDRFSLDLATDVFFGESAGTLSTDLQPVRNALEEIFVWNTKRVLMGKIGAWLPGPAKASAVVMKYLNGVIDQAISVRHHSESPEKIRQEHTLLGSFLARGMPRDRIITSLIVVVMAAKDPSSITLGWAFYELARNPHIVQSLREEIRSTVGYSRLPTAAQLRNMPLLQNVIKESLRLHHPIGINIREAIKDTFLPTGGGPAGKDRVCILQGTNIVMSIIGTQRRHDLVGPDADQFDPYRWETWTSQPWEFLPFNQGPRPCLGRNFAWTQMEYLICRMFQEFSTVELIGKNGQQILNGPDMKTKIALNMLPAERIILRFGREPYH